MQPVICLSDVTKRYGEQAALRNVSLEVPPGVVFALLGENGAGKSTTIKLLLGLASADSGGVEVLGLSSHRQALAIRRRVGYVPERPTLYEWMTVAEIGWFTSGFYPDGFLSRYNELVSQFALPGTRRIGDLSKGMRAKVSLALAMAHEPDLLILDEPTSGLDTLVRREFLESMVDWAAAGKTVFLSSHQIAEVERVSDIVAILRRGELLVVEQLDNLKDQVRQLTVTLTEDAVAMPPVQGEVIHQGRRLRQWQLLVRFMTDEQISLLQSHPNVRDVEVRRPSLEDIFVGYMQSSDATQRQSAPQEAPA